MNMKRKNNAIFLGAGELYFAKDGKYVVTVLGSCVSLTIYHKLSGYAGMFHALYPECKDKDIENIINKPEAYKYADCAVLKILKLFEEKEIPKEELDIKLFGGSEIISKSKKSVFSVGKQNVEKIQEILHKEGVSITTINTGGSDGRKIIFNSKNGGVFMKKIKNINISDEYELMKKNKGIRELAI